MKKTLFIFPMLIFLFSCAKNESELKITYHETKGLNTGTNMQDVYCYPNPFENSVCFNVPDANKGEILISDNKGKMKKIDFNNHTFELDFTNEISGAYYCEVHFNDKVFRTHLIKK